LGSSGSRESSDDQRRHHPIQAISAIQAIPAARRSAVAPRIRPSERSRAGCTSEVRDLPIVSPHGHTDPAWFADDEPFADPASLLIIPDHMYSACCTVRAVALEDLGVPSRDGRPVERDPRAIFLRFAERWHLFRGTPTRIVDRAGAARRVRHPRPVVGRHRSRDL